MSLPPSDTYRTLRGWVWALCAGGTSGMATHLWEEVGKQDKLRLAALSQQLVEEDWIQLLDFSTCRFVQEIGQQAAHYSLVAHDQDIFLPFKLHDDWFQTMNKVFIGLGCRQNVLSKLDSYICQACTLGNMSHSLILNMCDRMYCAVVENMPSEKALFFFYIFCELCFSKGLLNRQVRKSIICDITNSTPVPVSTKQLCVRWLSFQNGNHPLNQVSSWKSRLWQLEWVRTHLTLGVTITILVLISQSKFLWKILLDFLVGQLLTHTLWRERKKEKKTEKNPQIYVFNYFNTRCRSCGHHAHWNKTSTGALMESNEKPLSQQRWNQSWEI